MTDNIVPIPGTATPKDGHEAFTYDGRDLGANLRGFWSWACSDLLSNAMRGVLAEYIVGLALDCVDSGTRTEWDAADLRTATGLRVEVLRLLAELAAATAIDDHLRHQTHGWLGRRDKHLLVRAETPGRRVGLLRLCRHRQGHRQPAKPRPVDLLRPIHGAAERRSGRTEVDHPDKPATA